VYDLTNWAPGKSVLRRLFPYVEPHAWALASIAQTSTVWLVLLVTIDRYVATSKNDRSMNYLYDSQSIRLAVKELLIA
jgi:hypothetical protein